VEDFYGSVDVRALAEEIMAIPVLPASIEGSEVVNLIDHDA
jgi:hypothetical protein